ncbi:efflux RND transporter periplasmic adaptor subunit [uncultured Paraglaciecola sp.]|uniref:efflux RND transporter periplasmic adaptor subunit n=1 Tax=uncultured Paraglaciecola sp. TaxID=1765024 RepID=UPI0030D75EB5|tara:strand:+ start:45801 stop:47282 length:1482 start_codon:yes stop_codon:yes gene_type:complete
MKTLYAILIGGVCGGILSVIGYSQFVSTDTSMTETDAKVSQPLYWVAPMDPDYRQDRPGKSPMGMELVPVFADATNIDDPGVVRISANVVNNLGVRVAEVQQAVLQVPIKTVGYVQYNENNLLHVHPRVEGWIEKLYIKAAGEQVNKGEPLYALYSPELVNAQEEYLLAKRRNNKELTTAAESRLLALQMPAESMVQLKISQKVQQTIVFNAPQSGVIDNLAIREGFYVKPGTTLMSIGSLDDVWVTAEVFERQAAQVKLGQLVSMTLGFVPGKTWQGQVDYVYPTLDAKTRTLSVRLRFNNVDMLLKPNMFAQVVIHTDSQEQTLLIPKEAVIRTGTQNRVVLVVGKGQYKSVEVTLGQVTDEFAQILEGLKVGDQVVSSAQFLLDSESSINSDLKRMSFNMADEIQDKQTDSASVDGVINHINMHTRVANISRGAIEKWHRGPATMDFVFADSLHIEEWPQGEQLHFTFEIQNRDFVITDYVLSKQEHNHD